MWGKSIKNWWTTAAGLLAATGNYMTQVGKFPSTWEEGGHFVFSLGLLLMGVLAKDGKTGSSAR